MLPRVLSELSGNLVQNSSFEEWSNSLPASWSGKNSDLSQTTDKVTGSFALQLAPYQETGAAPSVITQEIVGLATNSDYRITLQAKGGKGEVNFVYNYKNSAGGTSQTVDRATFGPSGNFAIVSFKVHLPSNLTNITATVSVKSLDTTNLIIDDVSVSKELPFLPSSPGTTIPTEIRG